MSTQPSPYDVCRWYVSDHASELDGLDQVVIGYIRSRNLEKLSSTGELFDRNRHSVNVFRHLRQIQSFFKKYSGFADEERCNAAAQQTFENAERQCRIANRRLDFYYVHRDRLDPDMDLWISRMERYIYRTLGDFDGFLGSLPTRIRLTSGATATRPRKASRPFEKVSMRPTCTPTLAPMIRALYRYFGYGSPRIQSLNWNRVEAVPKNWKTHRLIACEPEMNIPVQLAFDDWVKEKLRYRDIDLSNQFRNQELAREGSIHGKLCTVDLSCASDTLALNTVHWLFPTKWSRWLMSIRTPFYRFGDKIGQYAKFSSMGNGATFGLETLVFAAACHALHPDTFSVYGDDIIIDSDKYGSLKRLLAFFGFTVNEEKSFHEGPFRESCGKDYFYGWDVTPFYLRDGFEQKSACYHNVNALAALAVPGGVMEQNLLALIRKRELFLVPYNGVSTSGIWIDVPSAYSEGLIKSEGDGILRYKAYVSKTPMDRVSDTRSLFLWYFEKYRRTHSRYLLPTLELFTVRSRVPAWSHKFVRKWVIWYPPEEVAPIHISLWTDAILERGSE